MIPYTIVQVLLDAVKILIYAAVIMPMVYMLIDWIIRAINSAILTHHRIEEKPSQSYDPERN